MRSVTLPAGGKGRTGSSALRLKLVVSTALMGGVVGIGQAQVVTPKSPTIVSGTPGFYVGGSATAVDPATLPGGVDGTSNQLKVQLNDAKTIITWDSFSVVNNTSTVNFTNSTAAAAAVLNRVTGTGVSNITGNLTSDPNVSVYLVNTNGITFGTGANVNVGALIASSLNLTNIDFTNGTLHFGTGSGTAGVSMTDGVIKTTDSTISGALVLLGAKVDVEGGTQTAKGNAAFVAGTDISIPSGLDSPLTITIATGTTVANPLTVKGTLSGQNVTLQFANANAAVQTLTVQGMVTANTAAATDKGVVLMATSDTASGGVGANIQVTGAGALKATGTGGDVSISAQDGTTASALGAVNASRKITIDTQAALNATSLTSGGGGMSITGAGTLTVSGAISDTNKGTISISRGAMDLHALTSTDGTTDGTVTLTGTSTINADSGAGTFQASGSAVGDVTISGAKIKTGAFSSSGGKIQLAATDTLSSTGLLQATTTITASGTNSATVSGGVQSGGDTTVSSGSGSASLSGNSMAGLAPTATAVGGDLKVTAATIATLAGTQTVAGTITATGTAPTNSSAVLIGGTVKAAGAVKLQAATSGNIASIDGTAASLTSDSGNLGTAGATLRNLTLQVAGGGVIALDANTALFAGTGTGPASNIVLAESATPGVLKLGDVTANAIVGVGFNLVQRQAAMTFGGGTLGTDPFPNSNGVVTIGGTNTLNAPSLTVISSSAITIKGSITTTATQSYSSAITLGGDATLTGTSGSYSTIDGNNNAYSLALDYSNTSTAVALDNLTKLRNFTIGGIDGSGKATISGSLTTTGTQTYNDAIVLGGTTNLKSSGTAPDGGGISFANTIDSDTTARDLKVDTPGTTTFAKDVGTTALASLNVATGATTFAGTGTRKVGTTGSQNYAGAVLLGTDAELTAGAAATIAFGSTINGAIGKSASLKTSANKTTFADDIGIGTKLGTVSALTLTGAATTSKATTNITTTGDQTYAGLKAGGNLVLTGNKLNGLDNTVNLTDANDASKKYDLKLAFTQGVTIMGGYGAGTLEVDYNGSDTTAVTTLTGTTTTSVAQIYKTAVQLGSASSKGDVTLDAPSVTFANTVDSLAGNYTGLTLMKTAGTVDASFGGNVGTTGATNTTALGFLNVQGTTKSTGSGNVAIVTTNGLSQSGLQTYAGKVTIGSDPGTTLSLTGVRINSGVLAVGTLNSSSIDAAGRNLALDFNDHSAAPAGPVGVTILNTGFGAHNLNVAGGKATLSGTILTTGHQVYDAPVLLGVFGDSGTVNTTSTATVSDAYVQFNNTVDNGNGSNFLHVTNTAVQAVFANHVGNGAGGLLAGLTVDGTTLISGTPADIQIKTSGAQLYQGAVTLGSNATMTTSNVSTGTVTFNSTLGSATSMIRGLTINNSATARFNDAIGSPSNTPFRLDYLHITGTGDFNGGDIFTDDFSVGNAVLRTNTTITVTNPASTDRGNVLFRGTLDSVDPAAPKFLEINGATFTKFFGKVGNFAQLDHLIGSAVGTTQLGDAAVVVPPMLVKTQNYQTYRDAVVLGADTTLTSLTGGSVIAFQSTLDSVAATPNVPRSLLVTTTGVSPVQTVFNDDVGMAVGGALSSLTIRGTTQITGAGTIRDKIANIPEITINTVGSQEYDNAVTLGSAIPTDVANAKMTGQTVSFANALSTIDTSATAASPLGLTVQTARSTLFQAKIGDTRALSFLKVTAGAGPADRVMLKGGVIKTTGEQSYSAAVLGDSNLAIVSTSGPITFKSTLDSLTDINGLPFGLTATTPAAISFVGAVGTGTSGGLTKLAYLETANPAGVDTGITYLGDPTVTSPPLVPGAMQVVTMGYQKFGQNVMLQADTTLTSTNAATTIAFNGTLDSAVAGHWALAVARTGVQAIDTSFAKDVGSITALGGVSIGGTTTIANTITIRTTEDQFHAGDQTYFGAVSLGGGLTATALNTGDLTSQPAIRFASTIDATLADSYDLTVNTAGLTRFDNDIGAGVALRSLTTDAAGAPDAAIGGATQLFNRAPSAAGGTIKTTRNQTYNDDVLLSADTTLTSTNATNNAVITFQKTVNSTPVTPGVAHGLLVTTTGMTPVNTVFANDVGMVANGALSSLTIRGTTQIAGTGTGTANPGAITINTVGAQEYDDAVMLGSASPADKANALLIGQTVSFANAAGTIDSFSDAMPLGLTIQSRQDTSFKGQIGGLHRLSFVKVTSDPGGTIHLGGKVIKTTLDQKYDGATLLADQLAIDSTHGPITFAQTLDSQNDGAFGLTVTATASATEAATPLVTNFVGSVGTTGRLASLTIDAIGTTNLGANGGATAVSVRTSGDQNFGSQARPNDVVLQADTTLISTNVTGATDPTAITFYGTLDSADTGHWGLTVPVTSGVPTVNTFFSKNVGLGATVANTAVGLGLIDIGGPSGVMLTTPITIRTTADATHSGNQFYRDVLTLGANLTTTAIDPTSSRSGPTIQFAAIDSFGDGKWGLTVNTAGATIFGGPVGGTSETTSITKLAYLGTDMPGTTTISGKTILTTGNQTYGDDVILGNDARLVATANNATILLSKTVQKDAFGVAHSLGISATQSVEIDGAIEAVDLGIAATGNQVNMARTGGTILLKSDVSAHDDIVMRANDAVTVNGRLTSGAISPTDTAATGLADTLAGGALAGNDIDIVGSAIMLADTVTTNGVLGDLRLSATNGDLILTNASVGDTAMLTQRGTDPASRLEIISLTAGVAMGSTGTVTFSSQGSTRADMVTSKTGDIRISNVAGFTDSAVTGRASAPNGDGRTDGAYGRIGLSGGNVTVAATALAQVGGLAARGDAGISGGTADIDGAVTAGGNYTVSGDRIKLDISDAGETHQAAGAVSLLATGDITGGAGLTLIANSDGTASPSAAEPMRIVTSGGDILFKPTSLLIGGNGNRASQVRIGIGPSASLALGVVSARSLIADAAASNAIPDVTITAGTITLAGDISVRTNLALQSGTTLTTQAIKVTGATQALSLASTGPLIANGTLASQGDLSLVSTGSIQLGTAISYGGRALVNAGGDLNGTLLAGGNGVSETVLGNDNLVTSSTDLTGFTADSDVACDGAGGSCVGGVSIVMPPDNGTGPTPTPTPGINIIAGSVNKNLLLSAGSISVTSTSGPLTVGTIQAGGQVTLAKQGTIGELTVGAGELHAGAGVRVTSATSARLSRILAGGDVIVVTSASGADAITGLSIDSTTGAARFDPSHDRAIIQSGGNVTVAANGIVQLGLVTRGATSGLLTKLTGGTIDVAANTVLVDQATTTGASTTDSRIGSLTLLATNGPLTLGTGTVKAYAHVQGTAGELAVGTLTTNGVDPGGLGVTVTAQGPARIGAITAATGNISIAGQDAITGLATTNGDGLDAAHGRANLVATTGNVVVSTPALAQLGTLNPDTLVTGKTVTLTAGTIDAKASGLRIDSATTTGFDAKDATIGQLRLAASGGKLLLVNGAARTAAILSQTSAAAGDTLVVSQKLTTGFYTDPNSGVSLDASGATITASGAATLQNAIAIGGDYKVAAATVTLQGTEQKAGRAIALAATNGAISADEGLVLGSDRFDTGAGAISLTTGAGPIALAGTILETGSINASGAPSRASDLVFAVAPASAPITLGKVFARNLSGLDQRAGSVTTGDMLLTGPVVIATSAGPIATGTITSTADRIALSTGNGSIGTGSLIAAQGVSGSATGGQITTSLIQAGGGVSLAASGPILVQGTLNGASATLGIATLTPTTIRVTGALTVFGLLTTLSSGDQEYDATVAAGGIGMTARTGAIAGTSLLSKTGTTGTTLTAGTTISALNGGRLNIDAGGGTTAPITLTAGQAATIGTVRGNGAVAITARAIDATTVTAATGTLAMTSTAGALTLGTGTAGSSATLTQQGTGLMTVGTLTSGSPTATADGTIRTAATTPGSVTLRSDGNMQLGTVTSRTADLDVVAKGTVAINTGTAAGYVGLTATNLTIGNALQARSGSGTVTLTNNGASAVSVGGADGSGGTGAWELSAAEINRISGGTLAINAGAAPITVRDMAVTAAGGLKTIAMTTNVARVDAISVVGAVSDAGNLTSFQLIAPEVGGGIEVIETLDAPSRAKITLNNATLLLKADSVAVGLDTNFLNDLNQLTGDATTRGGAAASQFVANSNSTLYNGQAKGGVGYSATSPILLSVNSLDVRFQSYALFQNTGLSTQTSGVATNSINLLSTGANAPNAFALFGTVNGLNSSSAALGGGGVVNTNGSVNLGNARVNGCLIGSSGGCLTSTVAIPPLQNLSPDTNNLLRLATDLALSFDPVVGSGNETLFFDLGTIDYAPQEQACDPDDDSCAKPGKPAQPAASEKGAVK